MYGYGLPLDGTISYVGYAAVQTIDGFGVWPSAVYQYGIIYYSMRRRASAAESVAPCTAGGQSPYTCIITS